MDHQLDFVWDAPEFIHYEKPVSWYWISMLSAIAILGFAMWQRNFLFGFFIIVAEILFLVWGNRESASIHFELNARGLTIGGKKQYPLNDIVAWSADEASHPEWASIWFQFKTKIRPTLRVHLRKNRLAEFREAFGSIVSEIEHEHTLIDALEAFVGF